jgi:hypothetical protein
MTHRNVETLIGKLATDGHLRRRFLEDPARVLAEVREQGLELSDIELQALASTNPDAIRDFAASVDRRIQKAEFPDGAERARD